jgi:hypothetical protein
LPAALANVSGGCLETRRVAANEQHIGAGVSDRQRHLPPEPSASARDEGPFAIQFESIED